MARRGAIQLTAFAKRGAVAAPTLITSLAKGGSASPMDAIANSIMEAGASFFDNPAVQETRGRLASIAHWESTSSKLLDWEQNYRGDPAKMHSAKRDWILDEIPVAHRWFDENLSSTAAEIAKKMFDDKMVGYIGKSLEKQNERQQAAVKAEYERARDQMVQTIATSPSADPATMDIGSRQSAKNMLDYEWDNINSIHGSEEVAFRAVNSDLHKAEISRLQIVAADDKSNVKLLQEVEDGKHSVNEWVAVRKDGKWELQKKETPLTEAEIKLIQKAAAESLKVENDIAQSRDRKYVRQHKEFVLSYVATQIADIQTLNTIEALEAKRREFRQWRKEEGRNGMRLGLEEFFSTEVNTIETAIDAREYKLGLGKNQTPDSFYAVNEYTKEMSHLTNDAQAAANLSIKMTNDKRLTIPDEAKLQNKLDLQQDEGFRRQMKELTHFFKPYFAISRNQTSDSHNRDLEYGTAMGTLMVAINEGIEENLEALRNGRMTVWDIAEQKYREISVGMRTEINKLFEHRKEELMRHALDWKKASLQYGYKGTFRQFIMQSAMKREDDQFGLHDAGRLLFLTNRIEKTIVDSLAGSEMSLAHRADRQPMPEGLGATDVLLYGKDGTSLKIGKERIADRSVERDAIGLEELTEQRARASVDATEKRVQEEIGEARKSYIGKMQPGTVQYKTGVRETAYDMTKDDETNLETYKQQMLPIATKENLEKRFVRPKATGLPKGGIIENPWLGTATFGKTKHTELFQLQAAHAAQAEGKKVNKKIAQHLEGWNYEKGSPWGIRPTATPEEAKAHPVPYGKQAWMKDENAGEKSYELFKIYSLMEKHPSMSMDDLIEMRAKSWLNEQQKSLPPDIVTPTTFPEEDIQEVTQAALASKEFRGGQTFRTWIPYMQEGRRRDAEVELSLRSPLARKDKPPLSNVEELFRDPNQWTPEFWETYVYPRLEWGTPTGQAIWGNPKDAIIEWDAVGNDIEKMNVHLNKVIRKPLTKDDVRNPFGEDTASSNESLSIYEMTPQDRLRMGFGS